ncbi:hypothetical protein IQ260_30170, partial [Leptolyngbya cf. ectocarpi LEGE 11479]
ERLIEILEHKQTELTAEDIADILWLTLQQWQFGPTTFSGLSTSIPKSDNSIVDSKESSVEPMPQSSLESSTSSSSTTPQSGMSGVTTIRPTENQATASPSTESGAPLALPDSPSLRHSLDILKALRPLIRLVPSTDDQLLDVPATVKAIAETDLWLPKLQPKLEPWLELALVVDSSPSMVIWQQTILSLRRKLAQSGVFRDVRLWSLEVQESTGSTKTTEGQRLGPPHFYLRSGYGPSTAKQLPRHPRELLDPRRRRLILVASDCIAPRWDTQQIRDILQVWGNSGPMALLQVLPEWLWNRTALLEVTKGQVTNSSLGQVNQSQAQVNRSLIFIQRGRWRQSSSVGLKLPVVTLDPNVIARWSQIVSGNALSSAPALLLSPVQVRQIGLATSSSDSETSAQTTIGLTPKERLERFRNFSSPMARRLAGYLAACPEINLPIVRMVQSALLPGLQQMHVAEVLLGGLFKAQENVTAQTPADTVQYEFCDGVRPLVQETVPPDYVFEALSTWLNQRLGCSLSDFRAYLIENHEQTDKIKPFAGVLLEVLKRRESKYTDLVQALEERYVAEDTQSETSNNLGYRNFAALSNHEKKNEDYRIRLLDRVGREDLNQLSASERMALRRILSSIFSAILRTELGD